MINAIIKNYKIKEKHKIYVETLAGKNHGQRRKLHHEYERNYESRNTGLRVEHKPKTKFRSQINNLHLNTNSHHKQKTPTNSISQNKIKTIVLFHNIAPKGKTQQPSPTKFEQCTNLAIGSDLVIISIGLS